MKRPAIFIFFLFTCLIVVRVLVAQKTTSVSRPEYESRIDTLYKLKAFDQALRLIDSVLPNVKLEKDWQAFAVYEGQYAKILKDQKRYEQAISRIETDIALLKANGLDESEQAGGLWVWKALQFRLLQRWGETLDAYNQSIRCYEKQKSLHKNLAYAYKNAAQLYLRFSDNHLAVNYLEAAMRVDTGKAYYTSICSQLANSYVLMDSLSQAEYYFNKTEINDDSPFAGSAYDVGAEIYYKKKNLDLAENFSQKALKHFLNEPDQFDNIIRSYSRLADISLQRGEPEMALTYYKKAESIGKTYYIGNKSREMAKLYVEMTHFYQSQKKWEEAKKYDQLALIQVFPNFNETNWRINPPLKDVHPEWQIAQAAIVKAYFLLDFYYTDNHQMVGRYSTEYTTRQTDLALISKSSTTKGALLSESQHPSIADRLIAADCFDLGLEAAKQLRQQSLEESDKLDLVQNMRVWTIKAIENLVEIQRVSPNQSNYSRLLQCIELSKSQALRDAINQKSLFDYIALPDSIRASEKLLRAEIADYKKNILEENSNGGKPDPIKLNLLNTELFRTEFAYRELIDQLKTEHPAFGAQLAAEPVLNVDSLRASLPDSAAILSFFDTGDRYLLLTTTRKGIELNEIPCDTAFKNLLSGFIRRLSDRSAQENDPQRYYQDAWLLYQKLLPAKALAGIKSLTIIPDGALCYLPFEALLTQAYKGSYARAPYLMRSYNVAYNWSAAIPLQAGKSGRGMLQVAPFTGSARDGLAVLPNSRLEPDNHIHLQSLTDAEASSTAFCEKSSDYAVLHIATHAQAGGQNLPRVEFFDRSLSAQEIYGLRLNAALVTLSACETGAGKYAGGEGVLSLARAFAAVGARTLVASHWTVNEFSTAQLFKSFYTYLFAGQTKSESLRAAKLAYLDSEAPDARKAPFYWAAFTLTGADGKVDWGGGFQWWYLWVALGIGVAVLFIRKFFV